MSLRPAEASPITPSFAAAFRREISRTDRAAQAYARFVRRPATRPRPLEAARWVALGMLLGAGSLYAATGGPFRPPSPVPAASSGVVTKPAGSPGRARMAPHPTPEALVAPEAEAAAPPSPREPPPPRGADPESWQRAARALRDSNLGAADDALARLSEQGSTDEREVVKLVRAQVLARAGQLAEARELLETLSRSGSAEHRAKATELLRQLAVNSSAHRSFDPDPHTN